MTKVNKNINTLDTIEIDSLKLRIPFDQVKILDYKLEDTLTSHWESTGELNETKKPNQVPTIKEDEFGNHIYSYKWSIVSQTLERGRTNKFLRIGLNTKALHQHYFKGISRDTVKFLYKQLMAEKKVYFSFETFLKADCTDIDFKKDIVCDAFAQSTKRLDEMTKPHRKSSKGAERFNKKWNKGIMWSTRKKATPGNPFFKIYDKHLMCVAKSNDPDQTAMRHFYNQYLKGGLDDVKYRVRIEYNLKDKKHLQKCGIATQTFKDLLFLTQDEKNKVLESIVKTHMLPPIMQTQKPKTDLKPSDMVYYSLMSGWSDNSFYSRDVIIKHATEQIHPASRRSEMKKKLESLWDTYIAMRTKAKENESMNHLFSALCWY